jgi:hypothetical protein
MAKDKKEIEQEIKDLASIAEVAFRNMSENIKDVFSDALSSGQKVISSITSDMQRNLNSLAKDSNKLIINQSRINEGLYTANDITKQILANEDKLYALEQQKASTIQAINDDQILSEKEKEDLIKEINKEYKQAIEYNSTISEKLKEQEGQLQKVEKKIGVTGKLFQGIKKIPILGDILNVNKGLTNMRKAANEGKSTFKILGEGIKGAFEGIEKASVILGLIAAAKKIFDFIKDAMFGADERVTNIAKGLMISKDEARGVYNSLKAAKGEIQSLYNTTKDVTEAYTDLINLTEFATSATNEQINAQIILTKNLGLSKEEAFGVQEAFIASNNEANKGKDIVYDQIASFANQNKLLSSGKKIFADIAKTSKLIQINFNGNLGALVKTTLEAKKLGLSLDQVTKIGSSLLNFEQSISSELEAELLTGKDINLEKARYYALTHNIAGLTEEISKQGITQEKFAAMNVIQQEALAGALGMSAEEMGDMLYKQKVLNKVGGETLRNLREKARVTEDINLQNKVAALEQGILSGKSLEEAEKATTAQEKFNHALDLAKEIFSDFIDGGSLDKFADFLTKFVNSVAIQGLGKTLLFGLASDTQLTQNQLQEKETALQTETDATKKQQLQDEIKQLKLKLVQAEKTEISKTNDTETRKAYAAVSKGEIMYAGSGPKFADGGIVTRRIDNASVGEAGPEAIIPLSQLMGHFNKTNLILEQILHKEGYVSIGASKVYSGLSLGTFKVQ